MAEDDRKPQTDPPEGSRKTVDHELARRREGQTAGDKPEEGPRPAPKRG